MKTLKLNRVKPNGITGKLADGVIKNWLIGLRETNPAILDIFADRDKLPYRNLLPWSGEFAGKYITGAYYVYMLTRNEELRTYIESFIDELISYQAEDGYLGCFQKEARLTGGNSFNPQRIDTLWSSCTWDAWNHYHIMYGLYLWYKLNGKSKYMDAIHNIALLFDKTFFNEAVGNKRLVDIGDSCANLAPYHIFAILAHETDDPLYLKLAHEIEIDFEDVRAGDFINVAEKNIDFYKGPVTRWESMHSIMGIAEMYTATGEERYIKAVEWIYDSIMRTDIHNTGAFSTSENARGTVFMDGSIETCCVIAFNALASIIYKYTGRHDVVDFLELSHYNATLGYYHTTGYWSTYSCPTEGIKEGNYHHLHGQGRPGSPNLNCCSTNAARGIAEISDWMLTEQDDVIYVNVYESLYAEADGFSIKIEGEYPAPGKVKVNIKTDSPRKLALRIPKWSKKSSVTLDGKTIEARSGEYLMLPEMKWDNNELILDFDFSVWYTEGQVMYENMYSIYYGPVLFGCDTSLVEHNVKELPAIKRSALETALPAWRGDGRLTVTLNDGITLSDFRTLGNSGCYYITYLNVE